MTRSGTTIVDRVLSSLPDVASFCEIRYLWGGGYVRGFDCSCGEPFTKCSFWTRFSKSSGIGLEQAKEIIRLQSSVDRGRFFWHFRTGWMSRQFRSELEQYRHRLAHAYCHLAETAGVDTLIDSSKNPTTVPILAGMPGVELYVVHVVRDLRGVINSWTRTKFDPGAAQNMPTWKPWETAMTWVAHNLACHSLSKRFKYQLVRYEDFAARPRDTMQRVVDSIPGLAGRKLPFETATRIRLPVLHSVSGNPHRHTPGVTEITPDKGWNTELSSRNKLFGTIVGYPLLRRYGYLL